MGNNHSTNGYSRLQPRSSSLSRPLLGHYSESMEQQTKFQSNSISKQPPPHKVLPIKEPNTNPTLGKEVNELKVKVAKLETLCPMYSLIKLQEKAIETIKKENAALDKKVLELTTAIDEIKRSTSVNSIIPAAPKSEISNLLPDLIDLSSVSDINFQTNDVMTMAPGLEVDIKNPTSNPFSMVTGPELQTNNPVDDLTGCLMILIFLIAILIGLLL